LYILPDIHSINKEKIKILPFFLFLFADMDLTTLLTNERITALLSLQTIQQRVKTFPDDWLHENNPDQTKLKMAEAGFFYAGIGDRVQCAFCLVGIEWWDPGEIPIQEHVRYTVEEEGDNFIFCPFLFGKSIPPVNTTGQDVTGTFGERGWEIVNTGSRRRFDSPFANWFPTTPFSVVGREASFKKWPDKTKKMDSSSLANAGIFYCGNNMIMLI
jgi:hypothetical protein